MTEKKPLDPKDLELPERYEKFWVCYWSERNQNFTLIREGYWDVEKFDDLLGGDGNWKSLTLREVREGEPEGPYWAWERFERNNEWVMTQSHRGKLEMCFPYGSQAEVARGGPGGQLDSRSETL